MKKFLLLFILANTLSMVGMDTTDDVSKKRKLDDEDAEMLAAKKSKPEGINDLDEIFSFGDGDEEEMAAHTQSHDKIMEHLLIEGARIEDQARKTEARERVFKAIKTGD